MTVVLNPLAALRGTARAGRRAAPAGVHEQAVALPAVAPGEQVRIVEVLGGKHLWRRLADLGLRAGSEAEVLARRGCGVVVRTRGQTVALGGGVARKLLVVRRDH